MPLIGFIIQSHPRLRVREILYIEPSRPRCQIIFSTLSSNNINNSKKSPFLQFSHQIQLDITQLKMQFQLTTILSLLAFTTLAAAVPVANPAEGSAPLAERAVMGITRDCSKYKTQGKCPQLSCSWGLGGNPGCT